MRMALAKAGFVVAAAEYRVVPDKYPALVVDAKAAVRFCVHMPGNWVSMRPVSECLVILPEGMSLR